MKALRPRGRTVLHVGKHAGVSAVAGCPAGGTAIGEGTILQTLEAGPEHGDIFCEKISIRAKPVGCGYARPGLMVQLGRPILRIHRFHEIIGCQAG